MGRGRHSDEIEFGSDSFLDVVANIVGILIILIVVAGIKAGNAAVSPERVAEFVRTHPALAPVQTAATVSPPTGPLIIPPSPELQNRKKELETELADLTSASDTSSAPIEQTAHQEQEVERQLGVSRQSLEAESAELTQHERSLAAITSRLQNQRTALLQLEVDVQNAERQKAPVKAIKHQLTPLSREIQGKEIHFRLLNNRVAYLPIPELMERVRPQIRRQRRLVRDGVQRGQAGPVNGFHMDYIIEAQRLSVVDELRSGNSVIIGVSDWRLVPEPDLEAETADEALKEGSDFLRWLRLADPDSTITLWVYPDSFSLYRKLQEFAHQENFTVAARPLPFGIPIAGSPRGSRSSGQ